MARAKRISHAEERAVREQLLKARAAEQYAEGEAACFLRCCEWAERVMRGNEGLAGSSGGVMATLYGLQAMGSRDVMRSLQGFAEAQKRLLESAQAEVKQLEQRLLEARKAKA